MGERIIYPKAAGIYKLTCNINGKIYIGKSINIRKRIESHKNCKKHVSTGYYFRNAVVKHGWDSFTVEILEIVENFDKFKDNHALLELESYYIKLYNSTESGVGYNIQQSSKDGTGNKKAPITEEHRANLRKARALQVRGPLTEKQKEKMRGRVCSEETRNKIRNTKKGTTLSEEHKRKIGESSLGRKHTEESIEKCRQAKLGIPRSPETIEKMRQAKLGKPQPREQVEKRIQTILNNKKLKKTL